MRYNEFLNSKLHEAKKFGDWLKKDEDEEESNDSVGSAEADLPSAPELRQKIEKKVEKIPAVQDLNSILKFTNKYSIKKDVEGFASLRQYKRFVSDVFLQSLADANISDADTKKFIKKLTSTGILNVKTLLTPGVIHKYDDLIESDYVSTFDKIKGDLFSKIAGKIGELGDVGKGEYLLDIIGNGKNVKRRGAPGDLEIDGTNIELKAGANGRLGPAGSFALAGKYSQFIAKLAKEKVITTPQALKMKAIPPQTFNLKLDMSDFSSFFGNSKNVKAALKIILEMHYGDTKKINFNQVANKIVMGSGQINSEELKNQMLMASFSRYKSRKSFDGIIIMDAAITKFLYISDPSDFIKASNKLIVKWPSWTDRQSDSIKISLKIGTTND